MALKLVKALLLERRVVIKSSSLAVTSAVASAAEAFLRPFRWCVHCSAVMFLTFFTFFSVFTIFFCYYCAVVFCAIEGV